MYQLERELSLAHFYQMEALEKRFYSETYITPAQESYAYSVRFPGSTIAASDGGRIVGFVNLFPVRQPVFDAILQGIYNDGTLTAEDLAQADARASEPLQMFLSCIAVEPAYRKQGLTNALLFAAVMQYRPVSDRCDFIATDSVTEAGRRFSQRLGFRFVTQTDHASSVSIQRYAEFEARVIAERNK